MSDLAKNWLAATKAKPKPKKTNIVAGSITPRPNLQMTPEHPQCYERGDGNTTNIGN